MSDLVKTLLRNHHIISPQVTKDEVEIILTELEKVVVTGVLGDVVEMGCWEGTTALFEARLLEQLDSDKELWLYDSFEGLPPKTSEDEGALGKEFKQGELSASQRNLRKNFIKANLEYPHVIKAWFWELQDEDLPQSISFAFLDGDFYDSIMDSLKAVWPGVGKGSVIVVDDYSNAKLPGVKLAVDRFFEDKDVTVRSEKSLAIIEVD